MRQGFRERVEMSIMIERELIQVLPSSISTLCWWFIYVEGTSQLPNIGLLPASAKICELQYTFDLFFCVFTINSD